MFRLSIKLSKCSSKLKKSCHHHSSLKRLPLVIKHNDFQSVNTTCEPYFEPDGAVFFSSKLMKLLKNNAKVCIYDYNETSLFHYSWECVGFNTRNT